MLFLAGALMQVGRTSLLRASWATERGGGRRVRGAEVRCAIFCEIRMLLILTYEIRWISYTSLNRGMLHYGGDD